MFLFIADQCTGRCGWVFVGSMRWFLIAEILFQALSLKLLRWAEALIMPNLECRAPIWATEKKSSELSQLSWPQSPHISFPLPTHQKKDLKFRFPFLFQFRLSLRQKGKCFKQIFGAGLVIRLQREQKFMLTCGKNPKRRRKETFEEFLIRMSKVLSLFYFSSVCLI